MKQKTIIAFTALTLLLPALALAEEGSDRGPRPFHPIQELKDKMEEKRADMMSKVATSTLRLKERREEMEVRHASSTDRILERKAEFEARKASTTAKRIEMQQGLARRLAENTSKVLTATVERLEKIITRLESRIAKAKAEGVNTSASEGFVAEAKAHLAEAKTSIQAFLSIDLTGDKAKDNFETVRIAAKDVKDHIKAAHKSLNDAISALKGPQFEGEASEAAVRENASSTSNH